MKLCFLACLAMAPLWAQSSVPSSPPASRQATPLPLLVSEAETHSPRIRAAQQRWRAARERPSQAAALPDPEFQFSNMSVGGPLPLTGASDNMMAATGVGVSATIPYPGKLHLRGEIAGEQAQGARLAIAAVRRQVRAGVTVAYDRIAGLQKTLTVLRQDGPVLAAMENIAESRYRVGQGQEADVLAAQLQQTQLQAQVAVAQQQLATAEAGLKRWLDRPLDSPDIVAIPLPWPPSSRDAAAASPRSLQAAIKRNPNLEAQAHIVTSRELGEALAQRNYFPDFHISYMIDATGPGFPYRSQLTAGVSLPLFWRSKQRPARREAAAERAAAQADYAAQREKLAYGARHWAIAVHTDDHLLTLDREGLMPQAAANWNASLAAYRNGSEDFHTVLADFLVFQNLQQSYWQTLADRAIAQAKLEEITGARPPAGGKHANAAPGPGSHSPRLAGAGPRLRSH